VVPTIARLAGLRLGPLTLGHLALLRRLGSPFNPLLTTRVEEDPSAGQVAMAWYVITRTWQEAAAGIGTRRGRFTIAWFTIRRAGRHLLDADIIEDWIDSEASLPPFEKAEGGSDDGKRGTPHELLLAQALASQWNVAWPAVLDIPVAQANWLWLARWEERNVLTIDGNGGEAEADARRRAFDPQETKARLEWAATQEARLRALS